MTRVTCRIARLAVARRMRAGRPAQQLDRVRHHRQDRLERLANALRAPRQVEHQRPADAPATARERAAIGVFASPAARISSASPGASRSITARVASGVTSRGPNPVPPVVTMSAWVPASSRRIASIRPDRRGPVRGCHVEAGLAQDPLGDLPGLVRARAVADAVGDREHGCDRSIDHGHILASESRFARAQAVGTRANASSRVDEPGGLSEALLPFERLADGDLGALRRASREDIRASSGEPRRRCRTRPPVSPRAGETGDGFLDAARRTDAGHDRALDPGPDDQRVGRRDGSVVDVAESRRGRQDPASLELVADRARDGQGEASPVS